MNIYKILFLLVMSAICAVMLSGCEGESTGQTKARWTDKGQNMMDRAGEACKKGVVYYVAYYDRSVGIAPAFNPDSTVRTCTE